MATNRYEDIPCNDNQRIVLTGGKYIHANYIKDTNGKIFAVATQGPLESTAYDFWSMTLQKQCPLIVMLCQCIESSFDKKTRSNIPKEKCYGYWPTNVKTPLKFKDLIIHADRIEEIIVFIGEKSEKIIKTEIRITDRKTNKILHQLDHFQYVDWEDHAVPTSTRPLMHLFKHYILPAVKSSAGPIIVHCSAGIGRTGVFVGALYMLDFFLHFRLVSMPAALTMLRRQRGKSVQSLGQYTFLHILLFELIEHATGKDLKDLKQKFAAILDKIRPNNVKT
uniref:Protein tyrosine phosphatase n=1 Tax=Panagrolaimus sp. ES5 TaxID=591445 RepID=A0AC34GYA6_9BILA